jgi:hypothetical protein
MSLLSMQLVIKTRYLESGFVHVYRSDGKKLQRPTRNEMKITIFMRLNGTFYNVRTLT